VSVKPHCDICCDARKSAKPRDELDPRLTQHMAPWIQLVCAACEKQLVRRKPRDDE